MTNWIVTDIIDTRDRDPESHEVIPDSGNPQPCDCCGRSIVIHVTLKRGEDRRTVGLSCARKMRGKVAQSVAKMAVRPACALTDKLLSFGLPRADAIDWAGRVKAWERAGKRWDLLGTFYGYHATTEEERADVRKVHAGNMARMKFAGPWHDALTWIGANFSC